MSHDDETYIFCFAVEELDEPAPTSITMVCQWPRCKRVIWVHPNSVEIALVEGGKIVCMRHVDALDAAERAESGHGIKFETHPLQADGIRRAWEGRKR